jgi:hypothetical protein
MGCKGPPRLDGVAQQVFSLGFEIAAPQRLGSQSGPFAVRELSELGSTFIESRAFDARPFRDLLAGHAGLRLDQIGIPVGEVAAGCLGISSHAEQ